MILLQFIYRQIVLNLLPGKKDIEYELDRVSPCYQTLVKQTAPTYSNMHHSVFMAEEAYLKHFYLIIIRKKHLETC